MKYIEIQCQSGCGGTGLYCGFAEPKGTAVVCLGCNGTGKQKFGYTQFTGRRVRKGVKTVFNSRGSFIGIGVGAAGKSIAYADFRKGKMP
jgi:hypothetical protein